ncbi:MAG: hypothetical protein R2712_17560 [Vicinamibacterales bacterium]
MREQVADRDAALAVALEPGHVAGHGIGEADAALLHQRHDRGGRGDDLCQRCQVKHRIDRHRLVRGDERARPVGLLEQHPIAAADQHHGAGRLAGGHGGLDDAIDAGEAGGDIRRRLGAGDGQSVCGHRGRNGHERQEAADASGWGHRG